MSALATRAAQRLVRAARMTLAVYALQTACALLLLWPLLADLAPELAVRLYSARLGPAEAALLIEAAARGGRRLLFWTLGCLAGWALLAPLLALAWLHAMARAQSLVESLARAASVYLPALALAGCALASWTASAAAAAVLLQPAVAGILPHGPALDRAWTYACLAAVGLAGLLVSTAHDLARARLALGARLGPALRFALVRMTPRLVAQHALLIAAALALVACAEAVTREPAGVLGPAAPLLQQLLVLGATLLRGAWLAVALLASEPHATAAPLADGDLDAERVA
jgi:hypothetical protein